MHTEQLFERYQELQQYVGWTEEDAKRVHAIAPLLQPHLPAMIDDFYAEIDRHPNARKVITGGQEQINRLKGTLLAWITELLTGSYDREYVGRRWRVGWRHVEIGLDQVYTNAALSRLRRNVLLAIEELERHDKISANLEHRLAFRRSINTLFDLDLAIIEDAYQTEFMSRLQRVERLAAIGQVAGGIAHEIRNPLNVVKTSVYYLRNAKNPSVTKTAEHLHRIEQHVNLADGVITALSNFAKMPVPDMHPFGVLEWVQETLAANPVPANVEVTLDLPSDLPKALGDASQLRIVLGNLIRNARDAMAQGGQLTIRSRLNDGQIYVMVADTGVGIPRENLQRIMEPLYTTKARGLGLGLAIARAILDKNGGTLQVASETGRGTVFTVRLLAAS